jgi:long-chain acyl-CoA synthetase
MKVPNEEYPLFPVPHLETLRDLVRGSAERYPDKLALEDLNDTPVARVTYQELADAVVRFGRALRRVGVEERDHVAVIAENRVQWVIAYLAVASANMVVVPIDKSLKENEIVTILHASDAKAVVFSEGLRDAVLTLAPSVKALKVFVDMDLGERQGRVHSMTEMMAGERPGSGADAAPYLDPEAVAVIVFTSGSMGRAKGVMLSQRNIASNLMAMLAMIELLESDRFLSVLPVHHTYECTCGVLCPLTVGASVHFARSLKTVVEDLQRVRATILLAVPLLYDKMFKRIQAGIAEKRLAALLIGPLARVAGAAEAVGVEGLRRKVFAAIHAKLGGAIRILIVGGAAPNPEVSRGMRSFGFTLLQGYGLTETSPIVALNRLRKFRDDAAGLPLPNLEVRIADPDADGRGEIVVRGPSVMLGYYKNEEATRQVLKDGWFYTGDWGFLDGDGFLHVSGRKKNVIVAANGKNVFPEELEDLVNAIPLVLESVVHGAQGANGDEEIGVIVVPNAEEVHAQAHRSGVEITRAWIEDQINREIRALNRKLPLYKQIRRVQIKDGEFEKTTTQKIKRYLIHQEDTTH